MRFADSHLLWLLLVFPPAMLAFFWWSERRRQKLLTKFIQSRLLPGLLAGISPAREKIRLGCLILAVAFLILTLARPQWGFDLQEVKQRGLDIVVAIDTSKSMLAEDIAPNRLARAKLAALDLMQQAKSDRLGLVAFAGSAFLQCPLTIDDSAFRQSVEALDVNIIPQGGTALADAIETALTAYKEGDNYKILVLFTDGEDQDSGAVAAAKKAAEAGMRIFTIGIGSAEGELLRVKDAKGRTDYIRDGQGNAVKSRLNEPLLKEIAKAANGLYLPLRGAKTIDTLYGGGLAPLPKSESAAKLVRQYHEHYHWPLAAAILLLLAEMLLPERKLMSKRKRELASVKTGLAQAAALLILLALPADALGSTSSALREYDAGKYDLSLKEYEQLLHKKNDDPRLFFNAGAAAYRNQKFDEAAKYFDQALISPDLKLQQQAYYNRGNALYQLGESNPEPSKKTESWEKSLKDYQSAQTLNPQDADAKFNYEFVKRKLEELKKQQQQQNQSKQDKSQNQDQQQQQDEQDGQSKNDPQQQQKQNQNSSQDQQQSQNQKQQEQNQQQQQQQNQSSEKKDQNQSEQQQAKQSGEEKKGEPQNQQQSGQTQAAGQMTPQQAQQLLDAQKGDEMLLPVKPGDKTANAERPIRDW